MFLKPSVLNTLMEEAYKRGLEVARNEEDWLYISGRYWEVSVKKEFIPKRTMGDIIALVGELPEPGERYTATKEGNQLVMGLPLEVEDRKFRPLDTLAITDVLLEGTGGTVQRLLQDEDTGHIYVANNVFIEIVDNAVIDEDKGECPVTDLLYNQDSRSILWRNNVCKMAAYFREDRKNDKVLKNLEGIDITPGRPEREEEDT